MKDINLAAAGQKELKIWALNEIDLKLSMNMSVETMRQRILDKCTELNIDPPTSEAVHTKQDVAKAKKTGKAIKSCVINIPKEKTPGSTAGSEPVFVGVQGVGYMIPRGIDIPVSPAIVEALKNAVQDIVTQDEEGEVHHEDVPTYPFRIVKEAA